MSTYAEVAELVETLAFPPGDIRLDLAALALEVAAELDAGGDLGDPRSPCNPHQLLEQAVTAMCADPNGPPTLVDGLAERRLARHWQNYLNRDTWTQPERNQP